MSDLLKVQIISIISLIFLTLAVAHSSPSKLSFQARIIKPNGKPLISSGVSFRFTVTDHLGTCVIYQEDHNSVNMADSSGNVTISVGSGTQSYPSTALTLTEVFDNNNTGYNCKSGGTYFSGATDSRKLAVQFNDGSGWQTISGMDVNSVPFAMQSSSALKLGAYDASEYLRTSTLPSCVGGQALHYNGSSFTCVTASGGGGGSGTVTSVSSTNPFVSVATSTTTPVITIARASSTQDGFLASSDYSSFSSKLGTTTAHSGDVTGTYNNLVLNNVVTAGTSAKVTFDAKGRVISSSSLNSSDITTALGYTPVSAAGTGSVTQVSSTNPFVSVATSTTTPVITIAQASSTQDGFLASTDWSIFNSKQDALGFTPVNVASAVLITTNHSGDVTGTYNNLVLNNVVSSGTATKVTFDSKGRIISSTSLNSSDITSALGFTPVSSTNAGTVTQVSSTNPFVSVATSTTTPVITIAQASSTQDGFLSSGDYTIFYNKIGTSTGFSGDVTGTYNNLVLNNVVSSGTATKVTFDSKGRIISSTSLNSSDITSALGFTPVSSTNAGTVTQVSSTNPFVSVATSTTTPVITIAQASSTQDGFLSSGDYTIFYNKIGISTGFSGDVTGTYNSLVLNNTGVASGTYSKVSVDAKGRVTASSSLNSSDITTALGYTPVSSTNAGTVTQVSSTNPFVSVATSTTTPVITIARASSTQDGFLSSTDWSIFSSKQDALGFTPASAGQLANYLPLTGGSLSGNLNLQNNRLLNVKNVAGTSLDPTASEDGKTLRWNNTSGQWEWFTAGAAGAGIASINGASGTAQTLQVGTNGSDFAIDTSGSIHTFNIPTATSSARGLLSSSDWSIFSAKLGTATNFSGDVTGTYNNLVLNNVVSSGTATKVTFDTKGRIISSSSLNSSDITSALGFTPVSSTNAGTVTQVSSTNPFVSVTTSTTTPVITIARVSGTQDGYLSSTDWSIFNNKQNALGYTPVNIASAVLNGGQAGAVSIGSTNSNNLSFITNNAARFTILASGDVGVGTSTPSATFSISGDGSGNFGSYPALLDIKANDHDPYAMAIRNETWGSNNGYGWYVGNDGEFALDGWYNSGASSTYNIFYASAASNSLSLHNGDLYIDEQGRVGLGTYNVTARLHLTSGTASAGTAPIKLTSGTLLSSPEAGAVEFDGTNLYYTDSGNVRRTLYTGAGGSSGTVTQVSSTNPFVSIATSTTTPVITIARASGTQDGFLSSNDWSIFNNKQNALGFTPVNVASAVLITTNHSGDVTGTYNNLVLNNVVTSGTATKVTYDTKGRIISSSSLNSSDITTALGFIPSNNASAVLNGGQAGGVIVGSTNSSDLQLVTNSLTRLTIASGTGNIGIGTSIPSAKLEVSGTLKSIEFSSITGFTNSEIFGENALVTGIGATALGANSQASSNNVALGQGARAINGSEGTAIGYGALAGTRTITIGQGASTSGTSESLAIGGYTSTDNYSIVLGYLSKSTSHTNTIIIGRRASATASNQFVAGSSLAPMNTVYFGKGPIDNSPTLYTIQGTGSALSGVNGGDIAIAAGLGGINSDKGGSIYFKTAASGTATALNNRMVIDSSGFVGIATSVPERLLHVAGPMRLEAGSLPSSPESGDIAVDSADANKLKWYNGSSWQSAGGSVGSSGTVTQVSSTNPFVSVATSTTTPVITIARASGTQDGFLASTDWSIFNSKQDALGFTPANVASAVLITTNHSGDVTGTYNNLVLSNVVSSGTATKVTFDTKGRIISSSSLNSADITSALGFTPSNVTSAVLNGGNSGAVVVGSTTVNNLSLNTSNTARITVLASGDVGIGTASPSAKLDISGTLNVGGLITTTGNITSTNGSGLTINSNNGALTLNGNTNSGYTTTITNSWARSGGASRSGDLKVGTTFSGSSGAGGWIGVDVTPTINTSGTFAGNITEMRISPYLQALTGVATHYLFDVGTNSAASGNGTHTSSFVVTASGSVGIGTTNPGQKLSVSGTIESTFGGFKFPDGSTQLSAANTSGTLEAWASFRGGAASATILASSGISSINRVSAGIYRIYWSSPFSDKNYIVMGTCQMWNYAGAHFGLEGNNITGSPYEGQTTTYTTVACRDYTNAYQDSDLINLMVFKSTGFVATSVRSLADLDGDTQIFLEKTTDEDQIRFNTAGSERAVINSLGKFGIGVASPTAILHLKSGTPTSGTAPLKLTSGTVMTTPEEGAIEFNGSNLFYTDSSGVRRTLATNSSTPSFTGVTDIINAAGNINVSPTSGSGRVNITSTTASTNPSTGALVVSGGVGVAGAVNVTGNIATSGSVIANNLFEIKKTNTQELRFNGGVQNQWRIISTINGATNGNLHFTNTTDDFSSVFNTPFALTTSGAVGIGTINPQALLDVTANSASEKGVFIYNSNSSGYAALRVGSSDRGTNGDALFYNSPTQTGIRSPTSHALIFEPAGTEKMRLDPSGYVGIGTGSPTGLLTLRGTSHTLSLGSTDSVRYDMFRDGVTGRLVFNGEQATYAGYDFNSSGTNLVTMLANGKVGIGTNNPAYKLDVTGGAVIRASDSSYLWTERGDSNFDIITSASSTKRVLSLHGSSTGTSGNIFEAYGHNGSIFMNPFTVTNAGNAGVGTTTPGIASQTGRAYFTVQGSTEAGVLEMASRATDANTATVGVLQYTDVNSLAADKRAAAIVSRLSGTTANNRGGILEFWTKPDAGSFSEKMRIDSFGNVGIGVASATAKLDVNGNAKFTQISTNKTARIHVYVNACSGGCASYHTLNQWTNIGTAVTHSAANNDTTTFSNVNGLVTVLKPGTYMVKIKAMVIPTATASYTAGYAPYINGSINYGYEGAGEAYNHEHLTAGYWAQSYHTFTFDLNANDTISYGYYPVNALNYWAHDNYTSMTIIKLN